MARRSPITVRTGSAYAYDDARDVLFWSPSARKSGTIHIWQRPDSSIWIDVRSDAGVHVTASADVTIHPHQE